MKVGHQTMNFMVDAGAEHSVVAQKVAPLSGWEVTTMGATGTTICRQFCGPNNAAGGHQVVHEFRYLLDYSVPLLGRDLLAKMGVEIAFAPDGSAQLHLGEEAPPTILSLTGRMEVVYLSTQ